MLFTINPYMFVPLAVCCKWIVGCTIPYQLLLQSFFFNYALRLPVSFRVLHYLPPADSTWQVYPPARWRHSESCFFSAAPFEMKMWYLLCWLCSMVKLLNITGLEAQSGSTFLHSEIRRGDSIRVPWIVWLYKQPMSCASFASKTTTKQKSSKKFWSFFYIKITCFLSIAWITECPCVNWPDPNGNISCAAVLPRLF